MHLTSGAFFLSRRDMTTNTTFKTRIHSIDFLRGIVIILMALDHVRDFFGATLYAPLDVTQTSPLLFMTRWITHLCAPTFMLLTGISAYLYSLKVSKKTLCAFLIKRGLFIILLEVTIVDFSWSFRILNYLDFQVMWALGSCMIILGGLIWLPRKIILLLAITIIFAHNLLDNIAGPAHGYASVLWSFIHVSKDFMWHHIEVHISYPILPWPGVMALGYCLGQWMEETVTERNKKFMFLGAACLILFFSLRYLDYYGDAYHWQNQTRGLSFTIMSFFNVTKYPPSLFYVLVTVGIITLLWPLWEKGQNAIVITYGKVALFFYIVHLPIIHILAELYSRIFLHVAGDWYWSPEVTAVFPAAYHFSLARVYLVWLGVLLMTYPLCLTYQRYKATHTYIWLKYL
jgi:uncharacterized membrane protein